ncbi:MAG: hypothetical protein ACYC33_11980 [Thermoleophilia bacterium]
MKNRVARIVGALTLAAAWGLVTWRWMRRWASRASGGSFLVGILCKW